MDDKDSVKLEHFEGDPLTPRSKQQAAAAAAGFEVGEKAADAAAMVELAEETVADQVEDAIEEGVEEIGGIQDKLWFVVAKVVLLYFLLPIADSITDVAFTVSLLVNPCFIDHFPQKIFIVLMLSIISTVAGLIGSTYIFAQYIRRYRRLKGHKEVWVREIDRESSLISYSWFQIAEIIISLVEDLMQFIAALLQSVLLNSTSPFAVASQVFSALSISKIWGTQSAHFFTRGCTGRRRRNCKRVWSFIFGASFTVAFMVFIVLYQSFNINSLLFVDVKDLQVSLQGTFTTNSSVWTANFSSAELVSLQQDSRIFFFTNKAGVFEISGEEESYESLLAASDLSLEFYISSDEGVAFSLFFQTEPWSGKELANVESTCTLSCTPGPSAGQIAGSCAEFAVCEGEACIGEFQRAFSGTVGSDCAGSSPVNINFSGVFVEAVFNCGVFSRAF